MPGKQKGRKVRFHSPANERIALSNDSEKVNYRKSIEVSDIENLPECDGRHFPCNYGTIAFDNMKDYNEYLQLKKLNRSKLRYRESVVQKIKSEGKYKQYIPRENRLWDLDTGKIYDVAAYKGPPSRKRAQKGGGKTRGSKTRGGKDRSRTRRCKK